MGQWSNARVERWAAAWRRAVWHQLPEAVEIAAQDVLANGWPIGHTVIVQLTAHRCGVAFLVSPGGLLYRPDVLHAWHLGRGRFRRRVQAALPWESLS